VRARALVQTSAKQGDASTAGIGLAAEAGANIRDALIGFQEENVCKGSSVRAVVIRLRFLDLATQNGCYRFEGAWRSKRPRTW
jgi:hypothetical protein